MIISMDWSDQGWGNRKSNVFFVSEEKKRTYDRSSKGHKGRNCSDQIFGGGRVVYHSAIAPHEQQRLEIKLFTLKENQTYHFWYCVGVGGGHSIHLNNVLEWLATF